MLKLTKELLIVGGCAANSYMFLCSLAKALDRDPPSWYPMIEIALPKGHAAIFPPRCAACGAAHPSHFARLLAHDALGGKSGDEIWQRIPCCWRCSLRLHAARLSRSIMLIVAVSAPV